MAKIVTVTTQKGGAGKTTLALATGACRFPNMLGNPTSDRRGSERRYSGALIPAFQSVALC